MKPPHRIRPTDCVDGFSCGHQTLDEWLIRAALRAEHNGTAITWVATDSERVVGYYCLSAHTVIRQSVRGGWLARNTPDLIPALLLGRLAVDRHFQGYGLGWSLLQHAVMQAQLAAKMVGARALVVDPIDQAAAAFYSHFGFRFFPSDNKRLFIPLI